MKKLVYLDMDGVLADFCAGLTHLIHDPAEMYSPGFFLSLPPIPGALQAVRELLKRGYDVHILTQPVANSPISYTEKAQWICMWLPELKNKITMTQDKGLCVGDFLVDDNKEKWESIFKGKFIHFDPSKNSEEEWEKVLKILS